MKRKTGSPFSGGQAGISKRVGRGPAPAEKKPKRKEDDEFVDKETKRILNRKGRFDAMERYDAHEVDTVDADDDESLDEDAAFDDSDEDRFGAHFAATDTRLKKRIRFRAGKRVQEEEEEEDGLDLEEGVPSMKTDSARENQDENGLEEDEEEEEEVEFHSDEDGELMDISELLGTGPSKAAPINASYSLKKTSDPSDPANILFSKYVDEEDAADADSIVDADEYLATEADANLESFVTSLNPSDRVALKRRTRHPEATEAYPESEFNLPSRAKSVSAANAKLGHGDLLGTVADAGFNTLRKQLADFATMRSDATSMGGLRSAGTEAAPLPTRIQDRIGRKAAFDESRKEVSKWTDVVKKNREADQLDFARFEKKITPVATSAALVSNFSAETSMEQEIANILKESALDEKKQMELEDLEMNAISKEEMIARRQELAKLRSLAFYAEQKAKKVAKIKSKTYRKIHRKADERKAAKEVKNLTLEELKDFDPDAAREQAEKLQTDRIKERMTQKHKSTGKWARKMLSRNDQNDHTRQALMNQLNQSHELTRKIAGLDSDQDSDDLNSVSDDGEGGGGGDPRTQLQDLVAEVEIDQAGMDMPTKGLYAMKFMQRGLEGQMKKSKEMIGRALKVFGEDVDGEEDEREAEHRGRVANVKPKPLSGGAGRMVFGGRADDDDDDDADLGMGDEEEGGDSIKLSSEQFSMKVTTPISITIKSKTGSQKFAVEHDDENAPALKIKDAVFNEAEASALSSDTKHLKQPKTKSTAIATKSSASASKESESLIEIPPLSFGDAGDDDDASNPWLTASASTSKKSTKLNLSHSDKAIDKMNRVKQQHKNAELTLGLGVTLNLDGVRKLETVKARHIPVSAAVKNLTASVPDDNGDEDVDDAEPLQYGPVAPRRPVISYDSDQDSDPEVQYEKVAKNFVHAADIASLTQRELMQIAFAGDNVAAEFEDEKERIIDADAPKVVDETLPGWGSWAGDGVKAKKFVVVTVKKTGDSVDASRRKDAKLNNVIINERRMKKATKYLANDLPFGYESREQYEQAIRMPLGVEWNTTAAHARLTAPKVVTKMGTIINPLKLKGNGSGKSPVKSNKRK